MKFKDMAICILIASGLYLAYDKFKDFVKETGTDTGTGSIINTKEILNTFVSVFSDTDAKNDQVFDIISKEAKNNPFGTDKLRYIRKIYDMAKDKDAETKSSAMRAISDISKDLLYASDRERAMDYVSKLF